jgi:Ca2+/H+ antiporter
MNSIDAIIALCTLMAGFALLLGAINEQNIFLEEGTDSIKSKTNAVSCATLIDSLFSNSAEEYEDDLECLIQEDKTISKIGLKEKSFEIITRVVKNSNSEVETLEHYKK